MEVPAGATDVTIPVLLRSTADSTETTGKAYTDVTASYQRQGAARVAITPATQTVTGAHADGGFVEIDGTNQPGLYRFDIPDAAFVPGADFVVVSVKVSGSFVYHVQIDLSISLVVAQGDVQADASQGATSVTLPTGLPLKEGDMLQWYQSDDGLYLGSSIVATYSTGDGATTLKFGLVAALDGDAPADRFVAYAGPPQESLAGLNDISTSEVDASVAAALVAIGLDHLVSQSVAGADVADGSIVAKMVSKAATPDWDTFNNQTEALEAIRDRGDASWAPGSGPDLLISTTIATVNAQDDLELTAGAPDNDAYTDALIIITDQSTGTQKSFAIIRDYVGASFQCLLDENPKFTVAVGDLVDVIAVPPHWRQVIETHSTIGDVSAAMILRGLAAASFGLLSGVDSDSPVFKALDGTTNRISATTDDSGRLTVTLSLDFS